MQLKQPKGCFCRNLCEDWTYTDTSTSSSPGHGGPSLKPIFRWRKAFGLNSQPEAYHKKTSSLVGQENAIACLWRRFGSAANYHSLARELSEAPRHPCAPERPLLGSDCPVIGLPERENLVPDNDCSSPAIGWLPAEKMTILPSNGKGWSHLTRRRKWAALKTRPRKPTLTKISL